MPRTSKEERVRLFLLKGLVCSRCHEDPAKYGRRGLCEHCYNIDNDERKRLAGKICQVPGCGRGIRMRGFCMSHYIRFVRNVEQTRSKSKPGKKWSKWDRFKIPKRCVSCGWDKAACDYHHVVHRSKGGTNDSGNIVYVCPNCHRLAHYGLLDVSTLPTLADLNNRAVQLSFALPMEVDRSLS